MRITTLALFALSLGACSDQSAPPPLPPSPTPTEVVGGPTAPWAENPSVAVEMNERSGDTAPSKTGTTMRERSRPTLDRTKARRVRSLTRQARTLARADNHAAAFPIFQQALALNPENFRLRCEAGFIAHRAGRSQEAERLVLQAMRAAPPDPVPTELKRPTAMCLYNVGLVLSAKGDTAGARRALGRSVKLRPNAVAQRKLDALHTLEAPSDTEGTARAGTLRAELSRVKALLMTDLGPAHACTETDARRIPVSGTPGFAGGLYFFDCAGDMRASGVALVIDTPDEGLVHTILALSETIASGETADDRVESARFEEWIPGGRPELVFELSSEWATRDFQTCSVEYSEKKALVVCNPAMECASIPLEVATGQEVDCPCCEDEEEDCEDECDDGDNREGRVRWSIRRDGDAIVHRVDSISGDGAEVEGQQGEENRVPLEDVFDEFML